MKKAITVVTTLAVLSFAACTNNPNGSSASTDTARTETSNAGVNGTTARGTDQNTATGR